MLSDCGMLVETQSRLNALIAFGYAFRRWVPRTSSRCSKQVVLDMTNAICFLCYVRMTGPEQGNGTYNISGMLECESYRV